MRRGRVELLALHESTSKERVLVPIGGVQINRVLLRKGAKYYDMATTRYLCEKVLTRLCDTLTHVGQWKAAISTLRPVTALKRIDEWTDVCGLLAPQQAAHGLEEKIASNSFSSYQQLLDALSDLHASFAEYEWQYVCETFEKEKRYRPSTMTKDQALALVDDWSKAAHSMHSAVLEDSKKEFGGFAKIGYGLDMEERSAEGDFVAVRGTIESNAVVQKLTREMEAISQRADEARRLIADAM
jgi:hypothetical protein